MRAEGFCFWAAFFEVESDCEAGGASGAEENAGRVTRAVFRARLRQDCGRKWIREHGPVLAGVQSQGDGAELVLKRPAGGEVNANAARRLTNAGADFEELGPQSFDLCGTYKHLSIEN